MRSARQAVRFLAHALWVMVASPGTTRRHSPGYNPRPRPAFTWVMMASTLKPPLRYCSSAAFSRVFSTCTEFWPPVWHAAAGGTGGGGRWWGVVWVGGWVDGMK